MPSKPSLVLKVPNAGLSAPNPDPQPTPGGTMKIKLNAKPKPTASASTPSTKTDPKHPPDQPKPKRKYTKKPKPEAGVPAPAKPNTASPKVTKKRARQDDDGLSPVAKRQHKGSLILRTSFSKTTAAEDKRKPSGTQRVKFRNAASLPTRPVGVGYDSEFDDAELDPLIESHFVLRMIPGEDCDYLRKAIDEKRFGLPVKDGGPDVKMKFFDREGRRAIITIRGNHHAASLVDLPCVIESMKSYDKKQFFKTADICQMLLVLGRVKDEAEAKMLPLPSEVDAKTWQYPHGLTPPMHHVRQRRFRKRVSVRAIEQTEEAIERLLAADDEIERSGGTVDYVLEDPYADATQQANEDSQMRMDGSDASVRDGSFPPATPAVDQDMGEGDAEGEEEDDDDEMARLMAQQFAEDDEDEYGGEPDTAATTQAGQLILESASRTMHASPDSLQAPGSAVLVEGATPMTEESEDGAGRGAGDDADVDGDGEGDDSEEESDEDEDNMDEEAKEKREQKEQLREEINDLAVEVKSVQERIAQERSALMQRRLVEKKKTLEREIELKEAELADLG